MVRPGSSVEPPETVGDFGARGLERLIYCAILLRPAKRTKLPTVCAGGILRRGVGSLKLGSRGAWFLTALVITYAKTDILSRRSRKF